MNAEIWISILSPLFWIGLAFWFAYWKGYIKRKSENQAVIEDTGTITQIEEVVKQVFRQELSNIELNNQHSFSIANEQRIAILNYNDALYNMYNTTINTMFFYQLENYKNPELIGVKFYEINLKYVLSFQRLLLLSDNDEIKGTHKDIFKDIKSMQDRIRKHINKFDLRPLSLAFTEDMSHTELFKNNTERDRDCEEMRNDVENIMMVVNDELKEMRELLNKEIKKVFQSKLT